LVRHDDGMILWNWLKKEGDFELGKICKNIGTSGEKI